MSVKVTRYVQDGIGVNVGVVEVSGVGSARRMAQEANAAAAVLLSKEKPGDGDSGSPGEEVLEVGPIDNALPPGFSDAAMINLLALRGWRGLLTRSPATIADASKYGDAEA